ncbi:MAG: flagellar hook-basal body complex protein FliE [Desulfobulbaceae bacterium]|nr:MAG: flagellar hook-basal body complex protein FliE [Desulfobulbaceae bacterium]
MIDPLKLQPVITAGLTTLQSSAPASTRDGVNGFGEVLSKAVDAVNQRQAESRSLTIGLVSGQHANIHETMIAAEKSSISFRLMVKVNQQILDAYNATMRIQL